MSNTEDEKIRYFSVWGFVEHDDALPCADGESLRSFSLFNEPKPRRSRTRQAHAASFDLSGQTWI